jgi:hypothetical protein
VWFAFFDDHTVHWRGEVFILYNGKIRPAHPRAPEHVNGFPGAPDSGALGRSAAKADRDKVSVHS